MHSFTTKGAPIVINDSQESYKLVAENCLYYEDPTNKLSINDILRGEYQNKFSRKVKDITYPMSSTFWKKIVLKSNVTNQSKWVLELLDSRHDIVEFYHPTKEGYKKILAGLIYPANGRKYNHKNIVTDIYLEEGETQVFYMKVKTSVVGSMFLKLRSNHDFSAYAFNEYYMLGIFYGILIIIAIYNFFLFFIGREKIYMYYMFYIVAWIFFSLTDDGLGFQYIWVDSYYISEIGFFISKPIMLFFFFLYSNAFFELRTGYQKEYRIFIGAYILFNLVHFFGSGTFFLVLVDLLFSLPFVIVFYVGIISLKKGFSPAKHFLIGNSFVLMGVLLRVLFDHQWVSPSSDVLAISMFYAQNIGVIFEIVILSWALGSRIRFLKNKEEAAQIEVINQLKENETLSQKVNQELEEKVKERTVELEAKSKELEDAYIEVQRQAEEINQMNLMLDLDNRKLQKSVKAISEARIKFSDVSYEEFKEMYPSDNAVLKYLSGLKWDGDFMCKKCNNEKFCKGVKPYAKRCTKCRYDESPTAFTLLHKCKFPLTDALYIVLQVLRKKDGFNTSEIASELDMRKATISSFKQKVEAVVLTKKSQKKHTEDQLAEILLTE